MKLPETLRLKTALPKSRRGVALVTVLTVMALTTILVLTFFSLASSEHRASNTYSHGLQAQQVAEQAVNLVIAQIREATNTEDSSSVGLSNRKAWASQPGAVRVWTNGGSIDGIYKLYSDDNMRTIDEREMEEDFDEMRVWSDLPSHYVDLNEPVIRGEKVYYPIVHPAASVVPEWPKPLAGDTNGVEGFSYESSELEEGAFGAKAAAIAGADDGHLAMPAMWLYQLADGTIGHLDTSGGNEDSGYQFVPISGNGTPSAENQMVARFAFWADDETCKLNLNTHAGGLAWDIPKAGGDLDMDMGRYQPAQKEWQRYPGHPATTHLGPALAPGIVDIVNDRDAMEMLYDVTPRVVGGGSESGTRLIDTRNPEEENGLVADKEPLFPSLDDMIMRSDREPHEYPNANGDPIPADELSEYLERSKFFITTQSRAPEVNMFNLPRVAIWPIYNAERETGARSEYMTRLTPFDRLIHYCASVGGTSSKNRYDYIFRRQNADSSTFDYENIDRNQVLYSYLDDLMEARFPGWNNSFDAADKYGDFGQDQVLTQIFDYIRTTNLHDDTVYAENFQAAYSKKNHSEHLTYTNPRDGNDFNKGFGHKGHGQVTPIRIGETKGFGRFYHLAGVDVVVGVAAQPMNENYEQGLVRYAGVDGYRGRIWDQPSQDIEITNIPPWRRRDGRLGSPGDKDYRAQWPDWLIRLHPQYGPSHPDWTRLSGPDTSIAASPNPGEQKAREWAAAFQPERWNWQLAFQDTGYLRLVWQDPSVYKYSWRALTDESFEDKMRLKVGEKLVQSTLMFDLFTPSIGWCGINPDMEIDITAMSGMTFNSATGPVTYHAFDPGYHAVSPVARPRGIGTIAPVYRWATNWTKPHREGGVRAWGGYLPGTFMFQARDVLGERGARPFGSNAAWYHMWHSIKVDHNDGASGVPAATGPLSRARLTPLDRGYTLIENALDQVNGIRDLGGSSADIAAGYRYDLVTVPFKIGGANPGLIFNGGTLRFEIFDGGYNAEMSEQIDGDSDRDLVQDIEIVLDPFSFDAQQMRMAPSSPGWVNEFDGLSVDSTGVMEYASMTAEPANPYPSEQVSARMKGGAWTSPKSSGSAFFAATNTGNPLRGRMSDAVIHWNGPYIKGYHAVTSRTRGFNRYRDTGDERGRNKTVGEVDVVQSYTIPSGDLRLAAAWAEIPRRELFRPHRFWGQRPMAHSLTNALGQKRQGYYLQDDTANIDPREFLIVPGGTLGNDPYRNKVPMPMAGTAEGATDPNDFLSERVQQFGDFDNGAGTMIDGPYINKPDEGNVHALKTKFTQEVVHYWESRRNFGEFPYFSHPEKAESGGPSYFSPNRIVSGPGMFGSLPTGFATNEPSDADQPWKTLLFRPGVLGGNYTAEHTGALDPPDHLIMDLFWMPVVEPYAISEPLSTAGKVNLNYQMVPYLHVTRNTALRGVFRSEFMLCIPNQYHDDYKHNRGRGRGYHWRDSPYGGELQGKRLRTVILEDKTLEQFEDRFNRGRDIFKSGTEICEIHLVPQEVSERLGAGRRGSIGTYTPSVDQMKDGTYWSDHVLVGDNSRERPYTNIQQRVTTKSNTFKVHFRAQVIKQSRRESDDEYRTWRPTFDTVQAEYRGSSIVERYVDPNDKNLEDYAETPSASLSQHYRYRVVNPRRFAP